MFGGSLVASAALLQVESGTLATFLLTVEFPTPSPSPVPVCTRTQGYWKTHPDQWPVDHLLLGLEDYTQDELLAILDAPSVDDASLILGRQQIAAKLNLAAGADGSQIESTISAADSWLAGFLGKLPYTVPPSSGSGQQAVGLADVLAQYNEGVIGPGSCDLEEATPTEEPFVVATLEAGPIAIQTETVSAATDAAETPTGTTAPSDVTSTSEPTPIETSEPAPSETASPVP
jgi:hypothetical protein